MRRAAQQHWLRLQSDLRYVELEVSFGGVEQVFDPTADGEPADLELYIHGWSRAISLATLLAAAQLEPSGDLRAHVVLVSRPGALITRAANWVQAADAHPPWHACAQPVPFRCSVHALQLQALWARALGFTSVVVYAHEDWLWKLELHPIIKRLVCSEALVLVRWSDVGLYNVGEQLGEVFSYPYYTLSLSKMHAILSFWGEGNRRVLVADLDELFATPHPNTSVVDLLTSGCLSGNSNSSWPLLPVYMFSNPNVTAFPATRPLTMAMQKIWKRFGGGKTLFNPELAHGVWVHEGKDCPTPPPVVDLAQPSNDTIPSPCQQGELLMETHFDTPPSAVAEHFNFTPTAATNCAFLAHSHAFFGRADNTGFEQVTDTS